MNNKPKMYQNKVNKEFHNNRIIYMSNSKNDSVEESDIRKKIDDILSSNDFIYRAKVNIVMDSGIVSKKIIGVSGNNLLTIDNELIPIDSIKDIYK